MIETAFIYTLSDPETGMVRYVGKTFNMKERLKEHMKPRGSNHKKFWILSLRKKGLAPVMEELETIIGTQND